ncbi:GrpB family protein [Sediminibacterium sp.]|uniref:GrpB family protein n=1 Tax=Sediminibacterium sp. TaxID=1917865 RepID=UPI003F6ED16F
MLLHPYSADWNTHFELIKNALDECLQGLYYTIEHIGSTAVPGLAAKPIIDIDIVFDDPSAFPLIKQALELIGYFHNGNQGIEDREVFKREGTSQDDVLDTIKHHLYVCSADSPALKRHLITRDYLRKNEWAKAEYQQMKYALAEKARQNQKAYAVLKEATVNAFIDGFY